MKASVILTFLLLSINCNHHQKNLSIVTTSIAISNKPADSPKPHRTDRAPPAGASLPSRIGDTVKNGVFTYRVDGVSFTTKIRSESIHETARGIFLTINFNFVNNDIQPHRIDRSLVRLADRAGGIYECSATASDILAMAGKNVLCSKECKAGEALRGILVFDVPEKEREYYLAVGNGAWKEKFKEIRLKKTDDQSDNTLSR
jgi:hypothetical protein